MRKTKFAASLLAVTVTAAALMTGCTTVPSDPAGTTAGTSSAPSSQAPSSGDSTEAPSSGDTTQAPEETDAPGTVPDFTPTLTYADGVELRMGTGYNSPQTGLSMHADQAGEGVTLADGNTYKTGDLKPTWVEVQNRLKFTIKDVYQGNSASDEFKHWKSQMENVDVVSGTASLLTEAGTSGLVVNLAEHLDQMPNFKAYLEANPIVRLSITGDTETGAIYFSPYFDGVNDIERMPLMRVDWVTKLLDGDAAFAAENSGTVDKFEYQPYMPTEGTVTIDVVKADGSATEPLTKDYSKYGNIIKMMNDKGSMSGVDAVNMLREYIDKTYGGYYGSTRSNLFIGQNAAWDADELVALLRCVVANSQSFNGTDKIAGLFSREDNNNQRKVDMMRLAGHLFGVRGLESRADYFYVGTDGSLHDARVEEDAYIAMERMNMLVKEGLVSTNFIDNAEAKSDQYLNDDAGFMSYDYNQTQTAYNETKLQDGEKYMAVMVPVALWQDGTEGGTWMRFTESWRSVKTDGWAISVKGTEGNEDKLNAALTLIDFAYSEEGQILMSYGPDAFIKTNADGSYVTFEFNGKQMPVIADETYKELWEKEGGNYTNYARKYLGSTLSFAKSQAFEFQCTHEVGKEGASYISKAIALGTIKHPELALAENSWYTSVPTVLPNFKNELDEINGFDKLTGDNSVFSTSKKGSNVFLDIMINGYTGEGLSSREEAIKTVGETYGVNQVLSLRNDAWKRLQDFYNFNS